MSQLLEHAVDPEIMTCLFCKGTGRCGRCDGEGTHLVRKGRMGWKRVVSCNACEKTGSCRLCGDPDSAPSVS